MPPGTSRRLRLRTLEDAKGRHFEHLGRSLIDLPGFLLKVVRKLQQCVPHYRIICLVRQFAAMLRSAAQVFRVHHASQTLSLSRICHRSLAVATSGGGPTLSSSSPCLLAQAEFRQAYEAKRYVAVCATLRRQPAAP